MIICIADKTEYSKVCELYEACGYKGGIRDNDVIVIAKDEQLIGAVRICQEYDVKILRGMQISSACRGQGVGTLMLKFLLKNLDMDDCYCIPYKHLENFYGQIGFKEISPNKAPAFLAERLKTYLNNGLEVVIMKHTLKNKLT